MYPKKDLVIDNKLLETRRGKYKTHFSPQPGEFVKFRDGVIRRIAHIWTWNATTNYEVSPDPNLWCIQTSDGGEYYMNEDGYTWMTTGSLYSPFSGSLLTFSGEWKLGSIWFWDRNWPRANGSVNFNIEMRLWDVELLSTEVW